MEKRLQEMEKRFIKRYVYCRCINQLPMETSQFLVNLLRFNNEFIFLQTRRIGANTALKWLVTIILPTWFVHYSVKNVMARLTSQLVV